VVTDLRPRAGFDCERSAAALDTVRNLVGSRGLVGIPHRKPLMKNTEKTDLALAAEIVAVVGEAAPEFDEIDVAAEAKRLEREHPESEATAETIAEVIDDQIDTEKLAKLHSKP
jgi:hypothetical protein